MVDIQKLENAVNVFRSYGEVGYDKAAYHRLIKKYHPDNEGNIRAAQAINAAWDVIKHAPPFTVNEPKSQSKQTMTDWNTFNSQWYGNTYHNTKAKKQPEPHFQKPIDWPWDIPNQKPKPKSAYQKVMDETEALYQAAKRMMEKNG